MIHLNKKMILALALLASVTCACAIPPGSLTTQATLPAPGPSTQDTTAMPPPTSVAGPFATENSTTSVPATSAPTTGVPTTPVVITPDVPQTPPPTPTTDTGIPAQAKPDVVSVALGRATYQAGQTVMGMVLNGLKQTIYSADMKTDCSIVTLEQLKNGSWEPVPGCNSLRAPRVVEIGTMRGQEIAINPLSTNFGIEPGSKTPAFGAGTYRLRFSYRLAPGPEGEEPLVVFSETFAVQP